MPAINQLQLVDSTNSTVNFTPVGIDLKGVAQYQEENAAKPFETKHRVSISVKRPTKGGSQAFRTTMKISVPTTDASMSPEKFVSDNFVTMEFVAGKNSSLPNRQNLLKYAHSLLGAALATALVENQEGIY